MSVEYCVEKFDHAQRQRSSSRRRTASRAAGGTAFHVDTMARTATVASAGRASGSRTRQKNPNVLQPSIRRRPRAPTGCSEERPQDDDRQRQRERRLRQGDAQRVARQPKLTDQDVQRQDRDGGREQQPEREQRVERAPGRGTRIGRRRTRPAPRTGHRQTTRCGDEHAVAALAPERLRVSPKRTSV